MPETDDTKIWSAYAKGVKRGYKAKLGLGLRAPAPNPSREGREIMPVMPLPVARKNEKQSVHKQDIQFDRRVEKQLRQGSIEIDARLDLHGMVQTEAYAALARFVAAQVKAGRRNILIITGKGRLGQSVLRNNLPGWLQSLPAAGAMLALRTAAPKHGGDGAFYLILRRQNHPLN